jgi:hypothetical protein
MKTIHYAGGEVLTSDEVADAVVDYAAALAKAGSSAELTIPVVLADGTTSEASMLLGPASQLVAQPAVNPDGELDDDTLVTRIVTLTAALGPARAQPSDNPNPTGLDEFGLE